MGSCVSSHDLASEAYIQSFFLASLARLLIAAGGGGGGSRRARRKRVNNETRETRHAVPVQSTTYYVPVQDES